MLSTGVDPLAPVLLILREWQTVGPSDDKRLAGRLLLPAEATEVDILRRAGVLEVLEVRAGLRVASKSFVGTVRLGSTLTVRVLPKIASGQEATSGFAALLGYALGLSDLRLSDRHADTSLEDSGFADIIGLLLLDEINALLRGGLLREYQTRSDWLPSPRGKIDITTLAQQPARLFGAPAIPCRYSERTTDTPLNRLARAALVALAPRVHDPGVAYDLQARAALLGELCITVPLTRSLWDTAQATLDRRSEYYRPVVTLAALVLDCLGTAVEEREDDRREEPLPGFLFDMNVLFERLIARLLQEYGPSSLRVDAQDSKNSAYRWRSNPYNWQRPRLRPDLVLRDTVSNAPRLILDTKYKRLGPGHRLSPEDLYQLTLYSLSYADPATNRRFTPARVVYPADLPLDERVSRVRPDLEYIGFAPSNPTLGQVDILGVSLPTLATALRTANTTLLRQFASDILH